MAQIDLFVYGTLKRGQRRHVLLAQQQFLGTARTLPHYRLYDSGAYPCLVADTERGVAVEGELYRVDDALIPILDEYEGAPVLFQRREILLQEVPGPVTAYFFQGDVARFRDSGATWP